LDTYEGWGLAAIACVKKARRFAGPLPYPFSYKSETHSLLIVEGKREDWIPVPVAVKVRECRFLAQPL